MAIAGGKVVGCMEKQGIYFVRVMDPVVGSRARTPAESLAPGFGRSERRSWLRTNIRIFNTPIFTLGAFLRSGLMRLKHTSARCCHGHVVTITPAPD